MIKDIFHKFIFLFALVVVLSNFAFASTFNFANIVFSSRAFEDEDSIVFEAFIPSTDKTKIGVNNEFFRIGFEYGTTDLLGTRTEARLINKNIGESGDCLTYYDFEVSDLLPDTKYFYRLYLDGGQIVDGEEVNIVHKTTDIKAVFTRKNSQPIQRSDYCSGYNSSSYSYINTADNYSYSDNESYQNNYNYINTAYDNVYYSQDYNEYYSGYKSNNQYDYSYSSNSSNQLGNKNDLLKYFENAKKGWAFNPRTQSQALLLKYTASNYKGVVYGFDNYSSGDYTPFVSPKTGQVIFVQASKSRSFIAYSNDYNVPGFLSNGYVDLTGYIPASSLQSNSSLIDLSGKTREEAIILIQNKILELIQIQKAEDAGDNIVNIQYLNREEAIKAIQKKILELQIRQLDE